MLPSIYVCGEKQQFKCWAKGSQMYHLQCGYGPNCTISSVIPTFLSFVTFFPAKNGVDIITHYIKFKIVLRVWHFFCLPGLREDVWSVEATGKADLSQEESIPQLGYQWSHSHTVVQRPACKKTKKHKKKTSSLASPLCSTESGIKLGKGWGAEPLTTRWYSKKCL